MGDADDRMAEGDDDTAIQNWALVEELQNRNGKNCISFSSMEKLPPDNMLNLQRSGPSTSNQVNGAARESKQCRQWKDIFKDNLPPAGVKMSDLTLNIGENNTEPFPVFKTIINIRCPALADEIGQLSPDGREVNLPIENIKGFRYFLRYLYAKDIKGIRDSELFTLLDLAIQYESDDLFRKCADLLKNKIKCQNVMYIHQKAVLYQLEELEDISFKFMLKNGSKVLNTDTCISMCQPTFLKLIQSDDLNCSELDIFHAAVRWATIRTESDRSNEPIEPLQLRAAMNQIIPKIRFPLLSPEDLADYVKPYEILTSNELVELYTYICARGDKPVIPFNCRPRVNSAVGDEFDVVPKIVNIRSMNNLATNLCKSPTRPADTLDTIDLQPDGNTPGPSRLRRPSDSSSLLLNSVPSSSTPGGSNIPHPPISIPPSPASDLCTSTGTPARKSIASTPNRSKKTSEALSDESDDMNPIIVQKGYEYIGPWDSTIRRFVRRSEAEKIIGMQLEVSTKLNTQQVFMPSMKEIIFDLQDDEVEGNFGRFERLFDIKKYIFYTKSASKSWKLEELWDMGIRTTIIVNGVTMIKMQRFEKELTISFRGDSNAIMSGLNKSDKLLKLNLIKTDVPNFDGFPAKYLQRIVFYNVLAHSETSVSEFTKKCNDLVEFSCWAVIPSWQQERFITFDLSNHLVSGSKLKHLAIAKAQLAFTPRQGIKSGVQKLSLDLCFWPANFVDYIHLIFPNLEKVAIRQREKVTPSKKTLDDKPTGSLVTIRMFKNLVNIPTIERIRIWGMDWEERHDRVSSSPVKYLRTSVSPIKEEELAFCKDFMEKCGLKEGVTNFIIDKSEGSWKGRELNDQEPKEDDNGFWDEMDKLEFEYFQLENVFRDYKIFQNNFSPLSFP